MKSLASLAPETEVRRGAKFVAAGRLARLRHYTQNLLSSKSDSDVEAVHQIRVYCRRVEAALDVLDEALPTRHVKRIRKRLKRLRQAAGNVRDADVLAIELRRVRDQSSGQETPAIDHLLDLYPKQRSRFLDRLHRRIDKLDRRGFWDWCAKHYSGHKKAEDLLPADAGQVSMIELARRKVESELVTFLAAFNDHGNGDVAQLHELRLATKRFRYVLEVFAGCFGPEFRAEVYDPLKSLQESLGTINDSHNFAEKLDRWAHLTDDEELASSLSCLRERYTRQLDEEFANFGESWSQEEQIDFAQRVRNRLAPAIVPAEPILRPTPSPLAANSTTD